MGNFILDQSNPKLKRHVFKGDFHSSHARALNKLLDCYMSLVFFYESKIEVNQILENLINEGKEYNPIKLKSHLQTIVECVKFCKAIDYRKNLDAVTNIRGIDFLSKLNIGITKSQSSLFTSYTFVRSDILKLTEKLWCEMKYDSLKYHLKNDIQEHPFYADHEDLEPESIEKIETYKNKIDDHYANDAVHKTILVPENNREYFERYYSNEELVKQNDLQNLKAQLNDLCVYSPISHYKSGKQKGFETIIVPRIIRSKRLNTPIEMEPNTFRLPEKFGFYNPSNQFYDWLESLKSKLGNILTKAVEDNNPYLEFIASYSINKSKNNELSLLFQYVEETTNSKLMIKHPEVLKHLSAVKTDLSKIDEIILTTFKTKEYMTYRELSGSENTTLNDDIFFTDIGFKLESLAKKPSPKPFNPDMNEVYQSLKKNSKLFKNSESIRPRTSSGGRGMLNDPNYAKKVFIVLNKDHEILYANFSKSASCRFLCDYAYTHEGFKLKNGITPVKSEKGIYNPETYRTSFYNKKEPSRAVNNYSIIELDVYIARYLEYLKTN